MSTKTKNQSKKSLTQIYGKLLEKTATVFEKPYRTNIYVRDTLGFLGVTNKLIQNAIGDRLLADIDTDKQIIQTIAKMNADAWFDLSIYTDNTTLNFNKYEFGYTLGREVAILLTKGIGRIVGIQPIVCPVGVVYRLQFQDNTPPPGDNGDRGLTLKVVTNTVTAKSRCLQTTLALEAMQVAGTLHNPDVLLSIIKVIAQEIVDEYSAQIIHDIVLEASIVDDYLPSTTIACTHASNIIARQTRRGPGNVIIIPPSQVIHFVNKYSRDISRSAEHSTSCLEFIGTSGSHQVFVSASPLMQDKIVVLYKGGSGMLDTGYIFAPYRVAGPGGTQPDVNTFAPTMRLNARFDTYQSDDIGNYIKYIPISEIQND